MENDIDFLGSLAFSAEEINKWQKENQEWDAAEPTAWDFNAKLVEFCRAGLNRILADKIRRQPKVWGPQSFWGFAEELQSKSSWHTYRNPGHTHSARLVCVAAIAREKK